jgi:hypothetical protein
MKIYIASTSTTSSRKLLRVSIAYQAIILKLLHPFLFHMLDLAVITHECNMVQLFRQNKYYCKRLKIWRSRTKL